MSSVGVTTDSSRTLLHTEVIWKCVPCQKKFANKFCLKRHGKSCRANSDNVLKKGKTCSRCQKSFKRKGRFVDHIKRCQSSDSNIIIPTSVVPVAQRKTHLCSTCQKLFTQKDNLAQHIKKFHTLSGVDTGSLPSLVSVTQHRKHSCSMCEKSFTFKNGLVNHQKRLHPSTDVNKNTSRDVYMASCPVCPAKSKSLIAISDHLRDAHTGVEIPGVLLFPSLAEFETWKHNEEKQTISCFVTTRISRCMNIKRYDCRRSGQFKSAGAQKRHMKMQGTCRIGALCPASMTSICTPRGVMVMYNSTHVGHSMDMKHIPLNQSEKQQVAEMISKGISFEEILNRVRSNTSATEISRLQLLTHIDLRNIVKSMRNDNSRIRRTFDSGKARDWVEKCQREHPEVVRFVKFQGEAVSDPSLICRIALVDFMVILMNDVQVQLLQKYGPHRVNCVDSTLKTKGRSYHLTTLIIIDDSGKGFPVAFCISSNIDGTTMQVFLEHVRTAIGGCVDGAILMTDHSPACVNAWTNVMGPPDHHILSTWDVDRSWRTNLAKTKQSPEVKSNIFKMLRTVLEANNKDKFHELLESSVRHMAADEAMTDFLSFFKREYVSKPELWAYSYRRDLHSHHVGNLEDFHRTLKHVFLDGTKVRPIDQSLSALLRLLRFMTFERLIKTDKWKINQYVSDISKRHALSKSLTREQIVVGDHGDCLVHDERGDYIVNKTSPGDILRLHASDVTLCPLVCNICNICVHTVTCTCMDYELRNTVCVHIHAVVQLYGIISIATDTDTVVIETEMDCQEHAVMEHQCESDSENQLTVTSSSTANPGSQLANTSQSTAKTGIPPAVPSSSTAERVLEQAVPFLNTATISIQPAVPSLTSPKTVVQPADPAVSKAKIDVQPVNSVLSPAMLVKSECVCSSSRGSEECLKELDHLWNTVRSSVVGEHQCDLIAIVKDGLKTIVTNIISAKKD